MSSLTRRIAIRMMKRTGYTRNKWIVVTDPQGEQTARAGKPGR